MACDQVGEAGSQHRKADRRPEHGGTDEHYGEDR
jgi:hypothetical protein